MKVTTTRSSRDIILQYPELFGEPPFNMQETLMGFGFEIGDGWFPIMEQLCKELSEIVKEHNYDDFRIVQVKEKFGTLRVYTRPYYDKTDEAINKATSAASTTCETCGEPGELRVTDGWYHTACNEHAK